MAAEGLALCRDAGDEFWTAGALNLLSEAALQAGLTGQAVAYANQALAVAQAAPVTGGAKDSRSAPGRLPPHRGKTTTGY